MEIIGEAARRVSRVFQTAHPEIPWRQIQGARHRLAHEYDEIRNEVIRRIVTVHVPELVVKLRPLVPRPPS